MTIEKQNAPTGGRSACELNFGGFVRDRISATGREEHIERVVAQAPPLTDDQRRRLAGLFAGGVSR